MPDRNGQPHPKHDPRACNPCGSLRHPAQAAQGRTLTRYLTHFPLPRPRVSA